VTRLTGVVVQLFAPGPADVTRLLDHDKVVMTDSMLERMGHGNATGPSSDDYHKWDKWAEHGRVL
jgi:hypothetical protein